MIKVTGLKNVQDILSNFSEKEAAKLNRNFTNGLASEGKKIMRKSAPKDEGTLRKNIVNKSERRPQGQAFSYVGIGSDAFYWRAINAGGEFRKAIPFVDTSRDALQQHLESIADSVIKKVLVRKLKSDLKKKNRKK